MDPSLPSLNSTCNEPHAFPLVIETKDICLDGFYCPNSNETSPPEYCPPSRECQQKRLSGLLCVPQGWREPVACRHGYYCHANGKLRTRCPPRHFCPTGSIRPIRCSVGAICPAGSMRQMELAPLYLLLGIDLLTLLAFGLAYITKKRRSRNARLSDYCDGAGSTNPDDLYGAGPRTPDTVRQRRAGLRADNYDGCIEDDYFSSETELTTNPALGKFLHSLTAAVSTSSVGLSFNFRELTVTLNNGDTILRGVTGTLRHGTFCGVMGGSGAGKSTFVNVLMGKRAATAGLLEINGHPGNASHYKRLCGYVPQDDVLLPELTVRENITHAAKIRLPAKWTQKAIGDHVDALIDYMQLSHVQNCRVGDQSHPLISGGQRKRVNIGIELAAAPMALFLDEPTSGLDSQSAAAIIRLLRAISRLGVTTIAIIHQPREQIFYLFDQVLLLSQGKTVYLGPTERAQPYFEENGYSFPHNVNASDTLLDIVTGDGGRYAAGTGTPVSVPALVEAWQVATIHQVPGTHGPTLPQDVEGRDPWRAAAYDGHGSGSEQNISLRGTERERCAAWPNQVWHCFQRACIQQTRRMSSFIFEISTAALAGGIIGLSAHASNGSLFVGLFHQPFTLLSIRVDYQSVPQLALLSAMAIGLVVSPPAFWVFGEERLLYFRETASGHSQSAYFVAKVASTLFRIVLSSLHFAVFLNILATPIISFARLFLAILLYVWCIYGLASMVSIFIRRENGPLVAVMASLVIGVFGGVAPTLTKAGEWHVAWLWRSSPGLYFAEAFFSENLIPFDYLYDLGPAAEHFGFTLRRYGFDIAMLFLIGSMYRVIAGLSMLYYDKPR